jgi:hypothetical protein
MEPFGFLIEVFVDFLVWLNLTSHKPLSDVISDLPRLYTKPAAILREHPVTIGPARPRGTILYATFALTLLSYCAGCAGLLEQQRPSPPRLTILALVSAALLPFLSYTLMARLIRGGWMVLHPDRVELIYRRSTVYCPWALFGATAVVSNAKRGAVALIVPRDAVPLVTCLKGDLTRSHGEDVWTRQLRVTSSTEVVLHDLYLVDLRECCEMLLHVGRGLTGGAGNDADSPA